MLETYQGILRDNRIEWLGEAPPPDRSAGGVPVHVTLLQNLQSTETPLSRGQRMAEALEKLAALRAFADVADPAAWERETRQDRPLPSRGE